MSAWDLMDVKVGDAVAVVSGFHKDTVSRRVVSRVTATQVVLDDGTRWTRRGYRVGASESKWCRSYAKPWDEAEHQQKVDERTRRELARLIEQKTVFSSLSMDQLKRIKAIVDETKESK